jgi:hypothetical protein
MKNDGLQMRWKVLGFVFTPLICLVVGVCVVLLRRWLK